MFFTLTSTAPQATDLGYLLHKHPDRVHRFDLAVGTAHVFYPEASDDRCTVALLVEVDPVGLVRGRRFSGSRFSGDVSVLSQYVNDRPYAASSMFAVALGKVFGTAMKGRCAARPDLEDTALPLTVHLPALPSFAGAAMVERLFSPLGWQVQAEPVPLDPQIPAWGSSRYLDVTLTGTMPLSAALSHLYVLLPVLDGAKHYWVSADEVDKLVRTGGRWLASHPEQELVTRRYLAHQRPFVTDATERLAALDDAASGEPGEEPGVEPVVDPFAEPVDEQVVPLARLRRAAVLATLSEVGAHRVVDLGCGDGALLRDLLAGPAFTEIVGVDVSARELDRAGRRLALDRMPDRQRDRLTLRQSSATYRDPALHGFDAVVLMEVVEHVDADRLPALEATVFGAAAPESVVVTTPNADYNVLYPHLEPGRMRHPDHRFEWTRAEFDAWCRRVADSTGYAVQTRPVGPVHELHGSPTQLAVFTRRPRDQAGVG